QAFAEDDRTNGVWADMRECFDHRGGLAFYDVSLHLDSAIGNARDSAVTILRQATGDRINVSAVTHFPLSRVIQNVNLGIATRRDMGGCHVDGGYFSIEANDLQLHHRLNVFGRVSADQQRELIKGLVSSQLSQSVTWRRLANEFTLSVAQCQNVAPNRTRAAQWFSEGFRAYWDQRYGDAGRAFRQAVIEAPEALHYRYWLVLSDMSQGRSEAAYADMLGAVARDRSATKQGNIVHSLQRVQGSTRMALRELEFRVRSDLQRRTRALAQVAAH
ncbi:MAG: hypothetical protein KDA51_08745, partial [Planctomycetales bacterium]|nr:hypothetical protein [Planctomycetales bacterium]